MIHEQVRRSVRGFTYELPKVSKSIAGKVARFVTTFLFFSEKKLLVVLNTS